jgi:glycosyltransferase involved in cell wall biosynthesis
VKKLLFITYYYPPAGGGGVQRAAKFAKYLPLFGWQPVVLTVAPQVYSITDESLLSDVPADLQVIRPAALQLPQSLPWRIRNWLARWFLLVDEQAGWIPGALRSGKQILGSDDIQAIYSTSTPYSAHLIARQLKLSSQLPWLADFRDPWITNLSADYPTAWHLRWNEQQEAQVVREANVVVSVSAPMQQAFRERYTSLPAEKFQLITNGFDLQDFLNASKLQLEKDVFEILYAGSFYGKHRTPLAFFQGLKLALPSIPAGRMRVTLCGNLSPSISQLITHFALQDTVQVTGYLSHQQTIQRLVSAGALLLIIGEGPGSQAVLTGKIFEYLAAQKPILALAPDGAASELIRTARAGLVVPPHDSAAISQAILSLYGQWQDGRAEMKISPEWLAQYERKNLTEKLALLLDEMTSP